MRICLLNSTKINEEDRKMNEKMNLYDDSHWQKAERMRQTIDEPVKWHMIGHEQQLPHCH
jgi:hypothetical protein